MTVAKREMQEKARKLRVEGLSVNKIAKELGVSLSSVSMWVRDVEITEEQRKILEANKRKNAENLVHQSSHLKQEGIARRRVYQEAGREQARQGNRLHRMGCILYWAEGAKARGAVIFVNSDPNMMLLFMRFLRECFHVPEEAFRLRLHCHTSDVSEHQRMKQYWLNAFNLKNDCFNKVVFTPGSKIRNNIIANGLCTICVYSTELTMRIYGAIQEYIGIDKPEWLFENGVRS